MCSRSSYYSASVDSRGKHKKYKRSNKHQSVSQESIGCEPCNLKLDVQSLANSKIIQFEKDEPFVDDEEYCVDDDDTQNPQYVS